MIDPFSENIKFDKKFYIAVEAVVVTVLLFLFVMARYPSSDISFNSEPVIPWNDNWKLTLQDGTSEIVSLPSSIPKFSEKLVTITKNLPEEAQDAQTVCVRSSLQKVRAYLDGEVLYEYGFDSNKYPGVNIGSAWVIFRIPQGNCGKELRLDFYSNSDDYAIKINSVYLSTKSAILFNILREYGFNFLIVIFLFTSAIIMLILHFFANTGMYKEYSLVYLSLFSFLVGIWILGESKTLQFFTGNQFLICNIAFFAFYLFPLPMTIYIDSCYQRHHPRFANIFFYLFLINFAISGTLGMMEKHDFMDLLLPCQILIVLFIITTICALIYEAVKFKNKEALEILFGFGIVSAFAACDFYLFFKKSFLNTSKFAAVGLLIYIIYMLTITLIKIYKINKEGMKSHYYKVLAFVDPLTQGNNRTAFMRDAEKYFRMGKTPKLVIFDLNNLKAINDTLGHNSGDDAIKRAFSCISDIFSLKGIAYRMGGDEFAVILPQCSEIEMDGMIKRLMEKIEEENSKLEYLLSVAFGYDKYDFEKYENFDEFFSHVDNLMYENKRKFKLETWKV
ncbi:MAG: diguanylate cyclase [Oscillospiraceae bacterium]